MPKIMSNTVKVVSNSLVHVTHLIPGTCFKLRLDKKVDTRYLTTTNGDKIIVDGYERNSFMYLFKLKHTYDCRYVSTRTTDRMPISMIVEGATLTCLGS